MTQVGTALPAEFMRLLDSAVSQAKRLGHGQVLPAHLALALLELAPELAGKEFQPGFLEEVEASLANVRRTFATPEPDPESLRLLGEAASSSQAMQTLAVALRRFIGTGAEATRVTDDKAATTPGTVPTRQPAPLAKPAGLGQISAFGEFAVASPPLAPRSHLVERIAALLNARTPQTPLIVASQGAGRTTLAQCLAAGISALPEAVALHAMPVIRVRPEKLIAGGEPAAGLSAALKATSGNAVLFIDDVDVLAWLSVSGPGFGLLRVLRSALHNPEIRAVLTIEATALDALRQADLEFFEELEILRMEPLEGAELISVAKAEAQQLGEFHGVSIPAEVVAGAVAPPKQADTVSHPGLAVMRLDRAASAASLRPDKVARAADLGSAPEGQQYVTFDATAAQAHLRTAVFGQDTAIDRVTRRLSVTRAALDLRPERPDGVFLLAGPTVIGGC